MSMTAMKRNLDSFETFNKNNMRILSELSRSRDEENPLSFPDLINRGTFDLELAAWLMSLVSRGASFIVGAGPGGVGKPTIIAAYHMNSVIIAHPAIFGDRISENSSLCQSKVIC